MFEQVLLELSCLAALKPSINAYIFQKTGSGHYASKHDIAQEDIRILTSATQEANEFFFATIGSGLGQFRRQMV